MNIPSIAALFEAVRSTSTPEPLRNIASLGKNEPAGWKM